MKGGKGWTDEVLMFADVTGKNRQEAAARVANL